MAEDSIFDEPQAPENVAEAENADPVEDTAPVSDPADEPQPTFNLTLVSDAELEAPVYITVRGLYEDVEPLPHPDDIKDSEGNFLPGYDENTPTLVQTDDGWERPESAEKSEPVVDVDEHGRLEISEKPVTVPAAVARALEGTPFLKIEQVRD